jgi:hypothetical protein
MYTNHQFFAVGCIRVGLKPLFFDETKDRLVLVKKPNLFRKFDCVRVRQNNSSEKVVNGISFRLVSENLSKLVISDRPKLLAKFGLV